MYKALVSGTLAFPGDQQCLPLLMFHADMIHRGVYLSDTLLGSQE